MKDSQRIERKLSDITEVTSGQGAPQGQHDFGDAGHYFIRAGSLDYMIEKKEDCLLEKVNDDVAKAHKLRLFPAGTILFAKSGMSATKDRVVILESPSYVTNHLAALIPSENVVSKYVMFWLRYFRPSCLIQDTSYPSIRLSDIERIRIPLPPLRIQKKIATILDKADQIRCKRQQALRLTDQFLQSAFLQMFAKSKTHSFLLSDLALKGRGTFVNGPFGSNLLTKELVSEGIPVIYIRDIRNGNYNWVSKVFVTPKKAEDLKTCKVESGDILIAKVGDPPGTVAIYPDNEPAGIVTQDVIRIVINKKIVTSEYLQYYLNSSYGKFSINPIIVEGTRSRFSLSSYKRIKIPVPPLNLQKLFSIMVRRVESVRKKNQLSGQNMEYCFQSLMQKAFRGALVF